MDTCSLLFSLTYENGTSFINSDFGILLEKDDARI